ncbi:MAG: phosphatase PAP2 family protein [Marinobacter sp.]
MNAWIEAAGEAWKSPFLLVWIGLVALFSGAVYAVTHSYNLPTFPTNAYYSPPLLMGTFFFLLLFCIYRTVRMMFRVPDGSLFVAVGQDLSSFVTRKRLLVALPLCLTMPFFFSMFTTMKNAIPTLVPFYLDPILIKADQWLHFGQDPWRWLQPLFGVPIITMLISICYKLWFFIKYGFILWQSCRLRGEGERDQFFIALLLCWIVIGAIMATGLSSAGPCFFGKAYPELTNPFSEQMAYLYRADVSYPVFDLWAQDYLWKAHAGHYTTDFSGISAMPSLHVSMATLFLLSIWSFGPALRWLFGAYLALIQIGSVHLGWHYALDGYIAIVMTVLIWRVAGWLVSLWHPPVSETTRVSMTSIMRQ